MDYRPYDGAKGRFDSIDVLAEIFSDETPYGFSFNNPVYFSDPTGLCPECDKNVKKPTEGQIYKSTGGVTYTYTNGKWTGEGGELDEVVVKSTKKKSSGEGQQGKKDGETGSALFGLIQNANVNSEGQSPLEEYRERRDNPNYNPGEDKWDRIFRLMNSSHMEQMSDFGSGGHNMFGGYGRAVQAAKGTYSVYQGVDAAGNVKYVGITSRNPLIRFAEHLSTIGQKSTLDYKVIKAATNLTREQARVIEQTLINQYGLEKNGGQLINKINSIAPKKWGAYGL